MALTLVVTEPASPACEPVGLNEVKDWCRIDTADNDATLLSMITAARQYIGDLEGYSGLTLIEQTLDWSIDKFPHDTDLCLPRWPVQSVEEIIYVDADGATQTWSAPLYQVDTKSKPARIRPTYGETWPTVRAETLNPIQIRFIAGYPSPGDVPEPIRTAIKALVAHWHEHREPIVLGQTVADVPFHVKTLIYPFRLHFGVS